MMLSEFVDTYVFARMEQGLKDKQMHLEPFTTFEEVYQDASFHLPRIYAKDGFSISIQCSNGHYCASENGTRTYGIHFTEVEWGYPSEEIDGDAYNAEDPDDTLNSVGGYVAIEDIENLLNIHDGFDYIATLKSALK